MIIIIYFFIIFFFPYGAFEFICIDVCALISFYIKSNQETTLLTHCTVKRIPASQGYIEDEVYVQKVTVQVVLLALRVEQIDEASAQDEDF